MITFLINSARETDLCTREENGKKTEKSARENDFPRVKKNGQKWLSRALLIFTGKKNTALSNQVYNRGSDPQIIELPDEQLPEPTPTPSTVRIMDYVMQEESRSSARHIDLHTQETLEEHEKSQRKILCPHERTTVPEKKPQQKRNWKHQTTKRDELRKSSE